MAYVWVALGGALGSVLRFSVGVLFRSGGVLPGFPVATAVVNALGAFGIGAVMAYSEKISSSALVLIVPGFFGGFTTFSSFSWETLTLYRSEGFAWSMFNVALNLSLSLIFVTIGFRLFK